MRYTTGFVKLKLEIEKLQIQGESGPLQTMTGPKETQDQTQNLQVLFLFIQ